MMTMEESLDFVENAANIVRGIMIDYDRIKPLRRPLREILESKRLLLKALYWFKKMRKEQNDRLSF